MVFKNQIVKKICTLAFPMILICQCFLTQCTQPVGSDYIIEAVRTPVPLTIDGLLDESAWQEAPPVLLKDNRSGQEIDDERISTRVMTSYDDRMLYVAFVCNDPDIWTNYTQRDEHLWEEEAVEVFIEVDDIPDTYVEIEVSPANVLFDSYIVDPEEINIQATAAFDIPGIRTAVNVAGTLNMRDDTDNSWTVEVAIPYRDLITDRKKNVDTNSEIKINFYRLDKNKGMDSAGYAWSPTTGRFHKPSVFGELRFKQ
jgi:hypothetical protein